MHWHLLKRLPRVAVAGLAAAVVVAGVALGGSAAHAQTAPYSAGAHAVSHPQAAAQDIAVSLSPPSGSDFTTDTGTLSWTVPSTCGAQDFVAVFMYQGSAPLDATTINQAIGAPGASAQQYFGYFYFNGAAATGSTSWPNVAAPGYASTESSVTYATTGDLVNGNAAEGTAGLGTGNYTLAVVCTNSTTTAPVLDSNGNPVAGSLQVNMGATGNSWTVGAAAQAVGTQVALSGQGLAGTLGTSVSLTATVTAADGSTPAGGVNFYAGGSASGTPLNGSTPVPVSKGQAVFSDSASNGYPADISGGQEYTAVFVPADAASYAGSTGISTINLIGEHATVTVTATTDPSSASTADVTATVTLDPSASLASVGAGGLAFITDGTAGAPLLMTSSGVVTTKVTGLAAGTHTFSAELCEGGGATFAACGVVGGNQGVDVTATPPGGAVLDVAAQVQAGTVTVSGTAKVGDTLTAKPGTWGPAGVALAYQWYASGKAISGAKRSTLVLGTGEYGKKISVTVTGSKAGYAPASASSPQTAAVGKGTLTGVTPKISGTAKVGDTLRVLAGRWTAGVRLAYQWMANGKAIRGATRSTYKITSAVKGKKLEVKVTGTKTDYSTLVKTSKPTRAVAR